MLNELTPLDHDGVFDGIMDLYGENNVDLGESYDRGVRAIIHRASIGVDVDHDPDRYRARRAAARAKGMLWGAFHFLTSDPVEDQIETFFGVEDGTDHTILMAVDWEGKKPPSFATLKAFVEAFAERRLSFPVVYGGNLLREQAEIRAGDAILAQCPLWYSRYDTEDKHALHIPEQTWPSYNLWQFCSENRAFGKPFPRNVLHGADFSRFDGTSHKLAAAWPFWSAKA